MPADAERLRRELEAVTRQVQAQRRERGGVADPALVRRGRALVFRLALVEGHGHGRVETEHEGRE